MSKQLMTKTANLKRRQNRIRAKIEGTATRPRLSVSISLRHVSAQLINDVNQTTISYVTTVGKKNVNGSLSDKASWIGSEIAKAALKQKIHQVVYDRRGKLYHGRVAVLAEAARKEGLKF